MYSVCDNHLMMAGFPHSDISGSQSVCRLPEAFRRLPRLSSPLTAKASTVCASSLDHITPSNLVTVYNVKTTFAENLHREHANFTLTRHAASESNTSVYFYHIPKFLKNSSGAKSRNQCSSQAINHRPGKHSFLSFRRLELMVEPSGIEPLTSCVQGRRSPS